MKESQKRLLLLGGAGVGLFWLLSQKSGVPGVAGTSGRDQSLQLGPQTGSCPVWGQRFTPGNPIPSGCAVGADQNGVVRYVDLHS